MKVHIETTFSDTYLICSQPTANSKPFGPNLQPANSDLAPTLSASFTITVLESTAKSPVLAPRGDLVGAARDDSLSGSSRLSPS